VSSVLVDAGPLVALINRRDAFHQACRRTLESLDSPLTTVWPAFTEAMYLLRSLPPGQDALLEMVEVGALTFLALDTADCPRLRALMRKYRDLPMDLADAALVRVAEREGLRRIFTLDRRDFSIYHPSRLGRFLIVP
jgi:uncharacterized protein